MKWQMSYLCLEHYLLNKWITFIIMSSPWSSCPWACKISSPWYLVSQRRSGSPESPARSCLAGAPGSEGRERRSSPFPRQVCRSPLRGAAWLRAEGAPRSERAFPCAWWRPTARAGCRRGRSSGPLQAGPGCCSVACCDAACSHDIRLQCPRGTCGFGHWSGG